MNEADLKSLIECVPWIDYHYKGSSGVDNVPELQDYQFAIVNRSPHQSEGSHWVVVYRSAKTKLEIFDSLGSEETARNILAQNYHLVNQTAKTKISLKQYQRTDSKSCGEFCIYFINHRLHRMQDPFEVILRSIFTDDLEDNESRVHEDIEKIRLDGEQKNNLYKQHV
jgi:hypothetical protein